MSKWENGTLVRDRVPILVGQRIVKIHHSVGKFVFYGEKSRIFEVNEEAMFDPQGNYFNDDAA